MSARKLPTAAAGFLLAASFGLVALAPGPASAAEDAMQVAEKRSAAMKSMGGAMRTIKGFAGGRGSQDDAAKAVAVIASTAPNITSLFPKGTGMEALPKSEAKPVIWEKWDEFGAAAKTLGEKAAVLAAAIEAGDKDKIGMAFGDLGRVGCGGCHRVFREKRN